MGAETQSVLDGITVVALTTNIPGPLAASRLRAMGARVIKIEPPHGDPLKVAARKWYEQINAGLEVMTFDFNDPAARNTLDLYMNKADILLTAMRARSLTKIGLDWKTLHHKHPRVCHIAITGEAPPNEDRAGHDLTYQAHAGTLSPPHVPRVLLGDMAAAERAVSAALGHYIHAKRTGIGSYENISITLAAHEFHKPYEHGLTRETGSLGGGLASYNIYAAKDGFVAVAALEPHFIDRLKALVHSDELTNENLAAIFRERTAYEWEKAAHDADVPLAAVR